MSSGFVHCSKKPPGKGHELAREIRTDAGLGRYGPSGRARERVSNREYSPRLAADERNAAPGRLRPRNFAILLGPAEVSRVRDQHEQTAPR